MANIKTAVSLPESLFEQAEVLAHELDLSRSRLYALALEGLISRYRNERLLRELDAAYGEAPDPEEQELLRHMRHSQRHLGEDET